MSPTRPDATRRGIRLVVRLAALGVLIVAVSGCTLYDVVFLNLPDAVTSQGARVGNLWRGSWITAWIVGLFVWALILWAAFRYRKRSDELPAQTHYNIPIEVLYTVVPFIIVAVLFYFTVRDQNVVTKMSARPDLNVEVIGFQWSWQFNYLDQKVGVVGRPGNDATLVLPRGQTVRFELNSSDVIHSFWVPRFLFKRDVIPGHPNRFEVTPDKEGTFVGKCAEFCGLDHSRMLFNVRVVSPTEFDRFIADAKAGKQLSTGGIVTTLTNGSAGSSS